MRREPIAEDLFTWPDSDPALIGGQCAECGRFTFPVREGCPHCGAISVDRRTLGQRGTLWTWTSQGFTPKAPYAGQFTEPWFIGLVELPGQLRVESILVNCSQEQLEFGLPMRLVVVPFRQKEPDVEVVTFAFAPDPSETSHA